MDVVDTEDACGSSVNTSFDTRLCGDHTLWHVFELDLYQSKTTGLSWRQHKGTEKRYWNSEMIGINSELETNPREVQKSAHRDGKKLLGKSENSVSGELCCKETPLGQELVKKNY